LSFSDSQVVLLVALIALPTLILRNAGNAGRIDLIDMADVLRHEPLSLHDEAITRIIA
jgi:hypothetical protein